jgi:hypothetical protein
MNCGQRAVSFHCQGSCMVGIIDLPERPLTRGVLVVAGQPHSRLGESRQYAMLARALARRGITVMRFDRRGVGDSEGCDHNDNDVLAALREFGSQVPALRDIVLLAPATSVALSEALACAADEEQISGLVLLETWHANQQGGRRAGRDEPALLRALAGAGAVEALSPDALPLASARAPALYSVKSSPMPAASVAASVAVADRLADAVNILAMPSRHDGLNWRRARMPRRRTSAEQRLTALAAQLCAFPGPVLLVAAAPGTMATSASAAHAGEMQSSGQAANAEMQAALSRLDGMVARHCPESQVDIVCASAQSESGGLRDGDGPGRGGLTDICASWLVSW